MIQCRNFVKFVERQVCRREIVPITMLQNQNVLQNYARQIKKALQFGAASKSTSRHS
jgi:hypothetical protein